MRKPIVLTACIAIAMMGAHPGPLSLDDRKKIKCRIESGAPNN